MSDKEYIIFSDESVKKGGYFSNFYGGVMVGSSQYNRITQSLNALKDALGFHGEVKWSKVTDQYLDRYLALMDAYFDEIAEGHLRVRVMFTMNSLAPANLTAEDHEFGYFKLYYQFIKLAFGLKHIPPCKEGTRLRLYFDKMPDTREKVMQFKGFIHGLSQSKDLREARVLICPEDIAEVRSHDHVILQCLDVILGAVAFRLNDKHKKKATLHRRGKRTIAKEKLYKAMNMRIRALHPNFNIGPSTGRRGNSKATWEAPYQHWCFRPKDFIYDGTKTKGTMRKRKSPQPS